MRVLVGVLFFPRGGSAHVCRAIATNLRDAGHEVAIVSGSRSDLAEAGDARAFYAGLDVRPVDFTQALRADDPLAADPPMHPSFEDRPDAPDPVFAALDDAAFERQVAAWAAALAGAGAAGADVLYLHHLTPLNEAAARVAPDVPVVGHLHGTELLMLEKIERGEGDWPHGQAWARRLHKWSERCAAVCVGPGGADRARRLLGRVDSHVVPNGFHPGVFHPAGVDREQHWRRVLCDAPRGWRPGAAPGTVRYDRDHVAEAFASGNPVLIYVGRFTRVKRLPLLLRAYAAARPAFARRTPLVLVGGYPGEWEGEHPATVAAELGLDDVFLTGWYEHHELPPHLRAADAVVLPSVREQFGQVLVEGMACGLPAIAVDRYGPATIVDDGRTGWLVEPDDEADLARALVECASGDAERRRRGTAARTEALARYSWPEVAQAVEAVLARAAGTTVAS